MSGGHAPVTRPTGAAQPLSGSLLFRAFREPLSFGRMMRLLGISFTFTRLVYGELEIGVLGTFEIKGLLARHFVDDQY